MNRRSTLKKLLAASGGVIALPYWAKGWTADQLAFDSIFSENEQELLATVVDTMIPGGDSVGALSVGVDKFLLKLIQDCYTSEVQEIVKSQLKDLEKDAQMKHGKSLLQCEQDVRQKLLESYSAGGEDQQEFFDLIKRETIRGFRTSKEVMTEYRNYKVAPGFYNGCVDIEIDQ